MYVYLPLSVGNLVGHIFSVQIKLNAIILIPFLTVKIGNKISFSNRSQNIDQIKKYYHYFLSRKDVGNFEHCILRIII